MEIQVKKIQASNEKSTKSFLIQGFLSVFTISAPKPLRVKEVNIAEYFRKATRYINTLSGDEKMHNKD